MGARSGMRLKGKRALVTGGADGIGLACAAALAEEGADIALVDINDKGLEAAAGTLTGRTGTVVAVPADVSDPDMLAEAARKCIEELKGIDILVNAAGIMRSGDILTASLEDYDRVLSVNARAPFLLTQIVARHMVDTARKGSIINITSVNAEVGIGNQLSYVTSKGALKMLTMSAALGLADYGIRVNAVGPGTVKTRILDNVIVDEKVRRNLLSRTPMKRFADPSEIGKVVAFLASDDASYITGQTIYVDGGRLALNYTVEVD